MIFNATKLNSYEQARDLVTYLFDKDTQVIALGFVDHKEIIDYYANIPGFKFFSKKNLTWIGKPRNPAVDYFINKPLDILIDLSMEEHFPIQYIVGLSNAAMRVGRFTKKNSYHDLMIDISKKPELSYLIDQIRHYLEILNKS